MKAEEIVLPSGITAHLIRERANLYGGMTLWWQQDGGTVMVSGPNLTQDDLVKIAVSVSKTGGLGQVELPRSRPTPTPLPAPTFKTLRPTWLPEPVTVREQNNGQSVTLGFDPEPEGAPHNLLTLTETPKSLVDKGGSPDPQASQEKIGGYDVTVIRRGQDCTAFDWDAGDLHLNLTNAYNPPGHLRYTCDQLRKVIESIH